MQLFQKITQVLERHGVADPAGLDGAGLAELARLAAPYLLDNGRPQPVLQGAAPAKAMEPGQTQASGAKAEAAPSGRVRPGETAASAMSRLHSGLCNRDAYAQGLRDLATGHGAAGTYFFLVPYAIGRHRRSAPPFYGALSVPEIFAVSKVMRALVAGPELPDMIARLPLGIQYRTHALTERLYDFQFAVLQLMNDDDLPDCLPSGPPLAEAGVAGLGACEAALHLVTAAIDMATESCAEISRNAAPQSGLGSTGWAARGTEGFAVP